MRPADLDTWAEVFDTLDSGLIVLDADQRVVGWNGWIAAASTVPAERAQGRRLADLFAGGADGRLQSAIAGALQAGVSSLLTHSLHPTLFDLRTRAGRPLVYDISIRPIGAKPVERCLIHISDVTVSAQRERLLRERQNARYGAAVDNAPDPILTVDAAGVVQTANPAAAHVLGFALPELLGKPIANLFEHREAWETAWRTVLGGQSLQHAIELVARRRDGSARYVTVSAARWLDDGRVFVTIILRDTSDRHAAEAALQRMNETLEERVASALAERKLLADIVETTDAFIQVVDLNYRLLAVNKASADEFERAFGVRPSVGDNLLELLERHPAERANLERLWGRALAGEDYTLVQPFGVPENNRRYYELKFDTLHDATGAQIAAFQFVYDVTERIERQAQLVRTEEALRQSQKMEAIGQLTGGIAHDFNNLLMGITGAMDILSRRIASGRYEGIERFLEAASASANRAAALTHRLLAFARRQPLDPRAVRINRLIEGMHDLLRGTVGEQVKLTTALSDDLWPVLSDANQLENALLNLTINARDAMPEGGDLAITTRNAAVAKGERFGGDEVAAGDYVVVCVSDTGVGMDAETVAKVVEPFFTTKPLGQGTGLGLSMIYGFVRQTGGHVRIESVVGEGTQVSLFLPRFEGNVQDDGAGASKASPGGLGESVLLVEDDDSVRLLVAELLRDLGYACIEATGAEAAIPVLASSARIDLMVTDVGLPGLNGRQLADLAREHRPDLKVLFVTGYAQSVVGAEQTLGPNMDMIPKPFALDALALKIREILAAK
jgi:PAS domain S-box-containing protein